MKEEIKKKVRFNSLIINGLIAENKEIFVKRLAILDNNMDALVNGVAVDINCKNTEKVIDYISEKTSLTKNNINIKRVYLGSIDSVYADYTYTEDNKTKDGYQYMSLNTAKSLDIEIEYV